MWGKEAEEAFRSGVVHTEKAEILFADCGEEAIVQAERGPIDLAIADLVLPGPGILGAYTLVRVGELCPDCRMIAVSDHGYVEELLLGVADVFVVREEKPSGSDLGLQLLEAMGKLLPELSGWLGPGAEPRSPPLAETQAMPEGMRSSSYSAKAEKGDLVAGKYRLGSRLGQGGMGEVFRAEDVFIQRSVAVKLLRIESSSEDLGGLYQRMYREVMIAGRLAHRHIVTVHDAGFDGERMYLVMALVDGQTLRDHIEEVEVLPRGEAIGITLQILDALDYAHRKGVIHRDLKPSNVLMEKDGSIQVADFGLAKIRSWAAEEGEVPPSAALEELTVTGMVLGTLGYMAPEQMVGRPSDPRSDLYSLGAILFEMLHGKALARVLSPIRLAACFRLGKQPPELPPLPGEPELDQILRRALSMPFEDRFSNCEEMAAALRRVGSR